MRGMVIVLSASIACAACASLQLTPLTNVPRDVHLEHDPSKTITVSHDMVFYDASPPTQGLRFPAGTYALEGQDGEYWYMRSSGPLGMQDFRRGGETDKHSLHGGIALGKYSTRSVPAAVYIDGEGTAKVLIWKLGKDFMGGEGRVWRKSF